MLPNPDGTPYSGYVERTLRSLEAGLIVQGDDTTPAQNIVSRIDAGERR